MSAELSSLTPLANNLWQSTIFVGVICLLTVAFKKNRAAVRYWLWFAASVKFLLPFSFLVALGSRLSWRSGAPVAQPQWSFVVDNAIQPFAASTAPPQVVSPHASFTFTSILVAVWLCGATVGLVFWLKCWMQMRRIRKTATPLPLGLPIPALSSSSQIEPGVVGVFRPVLLLPEGIESRLTPAQLEAIAAHEMAHVRRRDNLTAAIHMLVEIIFWFFPVVYWLRARLIEERENACDEAVVSTSSEPESYAEGIIEVCKRYVEIPAAYMSGISGSNLKKRVVRIVNHSLGVSLSPRKRTAVALLGVAAIFTPFCIGLLNPSVQSQSIPMALTPAAENPKAPLPSYDVASVKPDKDPGMGMMGGDTGMLSVTRMSVEFLIMSAYNVKPFQIMGAPKWVQSQRFDIEAKADDATIKKMEAMTRAEQIAQRRLLLQSLLADRFKLIARRTKTQGPVLSLVVSKPGRLLASQRDCAIASGPPPLASQDGKGPNGPCGGFFQNFGQIAGQHVGLDQFASSLSTFVGKVVLDNTGLTGKYDINLNWTPDPGEAPPPAPGSPPDYDPDGPSLPAALQDQLGLRLVSTKGWVETIVIDHIEEPTPN